MAGRGGFSSPRASGSGWGRGLFQGSATVAGEAAPRGGDRQRCHRLAAGLPQLGLQAVVLPCPSVGEGRVGGGGGIFSSRGCPPRHRDTHTPEASAHRRVGTPPPLTSPPPPRPNCQTGCTGQNQWPQGLCCPLPPPLPPFWGGGVSAVRWPATVKTKGWRARWWWRRPRLARPPRTGFHAQSKRGPLRTTDPAGPVVRCALGGGGGGNGRRELASSATGCGRSAGRVCRDMAIGCPDIVHCTTYHASSGRGAGGGGNGGEADARPGGFGVDRCHHTVGEPTGRTVKICHSLLGADVGCVHHMRAFVPQPLNKKKTLWAGTEQTDSILQAIARRPPFHAPGGQPRRAAAAPQAQATAPPSSGFPSLALSPHAHCVRTMIVIGSCDKWGGVGGGMTSVVGGAGVRGMPPPLAE